jgi:hypothetical protein
VSREETFKQRETGHPQGASLLYQTEKGARKIAPFHLSPLLHVPMGATQQALLFRQVKTLAEALHATGSVQNALLAGKEWMAF